MNLRCEELAEQAQNLLSHGVELPYIKRTAIERNLFATCKAVVAKTCGLDFQGFSLESRMEIDSILDAGGVPEDGATAIRTGFELSSTLSSLASGDPYLNWELAGPALPGRADAIRLFGKRLAIHAEELMRILSA